MSKSTHTRYLSNDHTRIGYVASSTRPNAKMRSVKSLAVSPGNSPHGNGDLTCIEGMDADTKMVVLYLSDAGRREVAKGVLMHLLDTPITIAADDELRSILDQCRKAVELQDEEARQVVKAVKEGALHRPEGARVPTVGTGPANELALPSGD